MPSVEIPYNPRRVQLEIHQKLKRFNVLVLHRRAGKTVLCINQLIASAMRSTKERPRFAYISPFYRQSKSIAWDYLKHYTSVIPGVKYNESELRVDLPNGARINLFGADNYDSLRGIYLDGVVLDEYAQMPSKAWTEVIRPALSDRKGWAIFIGTPKGHNAFYELYAFAKSEPEWYAVMYKASETQILPADELADARKQMTEAEYMQEYECSFDAAIAGAYYAEQIERAEKENRICGVPWEEQLEVHTAWDIGFDDATSIIFYQLVGKEIRIIDFEEHNGESLPFYAALLKRKGYIYGIHTLPHDAAHKRINTGKSVEEQLQELGVTNTNVLPVLPVDAGIQRTRTLFPRLYIDDKSERTRYFLECIRHYHKEFDEDRKVFRSKPEHDWSSNAADALRYLCLAIEEPTPQQAPVYRDYSAGRLGV